MLKKVISVILAFILIGTIIFFIIDEPVPQGVKGEKVEALTDSMFLAINYDAWQNTNIISWEFPGGHIHTWDKKRNFSIVEWDNHKVVFQIDSLKGIAYENGSKVEDKESAPLIKKAWEFWANDSFWLNAPAKVRDGGTERQLVKLEDGTNGILVLYHGGGVTPGDKYLWVLDKNYMPLYCKMWVSIIPIGGVKFTWENWLSLSTGAKVAQDHEGIIGVGLKNIKAGSTVSSLYPNGDPFEELIGILD